LGGGLMFVAAEPKTLTVRSFEKNSISLLCLNPLYIAEMFLLFRKPLIYSVSGYGVFS
jgi:hypothetical protein